MRNHDLVSLGDNFINSYRQDLNFAFPFRVQEPKTVACSSKWAEGQVKTPHMHKQSCTSRFGAWSGSTPPLSLWTPLRFRSWPEGRGWIPILFGGRNAGWSAYHFTQSSAVVLPCHKMLVRPKRHQPPGHHGSETMMKNKSDLQVTHGLCFVTA